MVLPRDFGRLDDRDRAANPPGVGGVILGVVFGAKLGDCGRDIGGVGLRLEVLGWFSGVEAPAAAPLSFLPNAADSGEGRSGLALLGCGSSVEMSPFLPKFFSLFLLWRA